MHKECTCGLAVLSALILVFSFWQIGVSNWIIVVAAALIFISSLFELIKHGCSCKDGSCLPKKKNKEEISITGDPSAKMPSKKEVSEAMNKATKKKVVKQA